MYPAVPYIYKDISGSMKKLKIIFTALAFKKNLNNFLMSFIITTSLTGSHYWLTTRISQGLFLSENASTFLALCLLLEYKIFLIVVFLPVTHIDLLSVADLTAVTTAPLSNIYLQITSPVKDIISSSATFV